jgi:acyl carrier protein
MAVDEKAVFKEICRLLTPFNHDNVELTGATDITADLHIDSVSIMDFVMEVEDRFDIDIPLNLLAETRTLADLTREVSKLATSTS